MRVYIFSLIVFFFFFSCKKPDLEISTSVRKQDSLLILDIKNTTVKNLLIEIPTLDDFWYKDEYDKLNPEYFFQDSKIQMIRNIDDSMKYSHLKCNIVLGNKVSNYPKFIDSKATKKYYYKIKHYKKGNTILLRDENLHVFLKNSNNEKYFSHIKNQKCGKYEYFTGSFEFYPKQIILP